MIIESNDKDSSKSSSQAKDTTAVNNEDVNHKHEHEDKHEHYYHHVAEAAAGDKNDDVTRCRICDSNGWAHEPIRWSRIYGSPLRCNNGDFRLQANQLCHRHMTST